MFLKHRNDMLLTVRSSEYPPLLGGAGHTIPSSFSAVGPDEKSTFLIMDMAPDTDTESHKALERKERKGFHPASAE